MTPANEMQARSIARVMRRALEQDDLTPEEQRLSFRTLCEMVLPLLEQLVDEEET